MVICRSGRRVQVRSLLMHTLDEVVELFEANVMPEGVEPDCLQREQTRAAPAVFRIHLDADEAAPRLRPSLADFEREIVALVNDTLLAVECAQNSKAVSSNINKSKYMC